MTRRNLFGTLFAIPFLSLIKTDDRKREQWIKDGVLVEGNEVRLRSAFAFYQVGPYKADGTLGPAPAQWVILLRVQGRVLAATKEGEVWPWRKFTNERRALEVLHQYRALEYEECVRQLA